MRVHADERTLPTQEEVRRWIATNLDTPPLFREGDVLTHKDLAKLQPFLPPGYIEEFDFTDDAWSFLPQLRKVRRFSLQERDTPVAGTEMTIDDFTGFSGRVLDH
jgi:hypothetical protein